MMKINFMINLIFQATQRHIRKYMTEESEGDGGKQRYLSSGWLLT